jgi:hypothetical protein
MSKTSPSRTRRLWFVGTAFTTLTAIVGAIVTLQSTSAEATSAPPRRACLCPWQPCCKKT